MESIYSGMAKNIQLRVRLREEYQTQLLAIAKEKRMNLSEVVREALDEYLSPTRQDSNAFVVSVDNPTHERVVEMAQVLDRTECNVVEECVSSIFDAYKNNRTPLIVLELNLRRKYFQELSEQGLAGR